MTMTIVKQGLMYSKDHEWVEVIGENVVRIGITDYAQSQLGDIVFVELPETNTELVSGESMGSIESVKTVSDLYSPVNGKVLKVNLQLIEEPEYVNSECYTQGWMIEVELLGDQESEMATLLTPQLYTQYTES
jgi:glycine cleavage system H protein